MSTFLLYKGDGGQITKHIFLFYDANSAPYIPVFNITAEVEKGGV